MNPRVADGFPRVPEGEGPGSGVCAPRRHQRPRTGSLETPVEFSFNFFLFGFFSFLFSLVFCRKFNTLPVGGFFPSECNISPFGSRLLPMREQDYFSSLMETVLGFFASPSLQFLI